VERRQSVDGVLPPHRRPPAPLVGSYFYREMGKPRIALTVAGKG